MLNDVDVDVFERKWDELVRGFGLEENVWMLDMYQKRKMWATTHIRGKCFAGLRTTSQCEVCIMNLENMYQFFPTCLIFYKNIFVG